MCVSLVIKGEPSATSCWWLTQRYRCWGRTQDTAECLTFLVADVKWLSDGESESSVLLLGSVDWQIWKWLLLLSAKLGGDTINFSIIIIIPMLTTLNCSTSVICKVCVDVTSFRNRWKIKFLTGQGRLVICSNNDFVNHFDDDKNKYGTITYYFDARMTVDLFVI